MPVMKKGASLISLVTGGTSGIGFAVCERMMREGMNVIVVGRYLQTVENAVKLLNEKHVNNNNNYDNNNDNKAVPLVMDVGLLNRNQIAEKIKIGIDQFKKGDNDNNNNYNNYVSVLVNAAGVNHDMLLMKIDDKNREEIINTNLIGALNTTSAVVPMMMKQKFGRIVNIGSIVGNEIGNVGQTVYSISKSGLIGLTKSTAAELSSRNILCNLVQPGFIETRMTKDLTSSASLHNNLNSKIPVGRLGKPEEVADLIYFLSNPNNTYITGQVINIDGGLTIAL